MPAPYSEVLSLNPGSKIDYLNEVFCNFLQSSQNHTWQTDQL